MLSGPFLSGFSARRDPALSLRGFGASPPRSNCPTQTGAVVAVIVPGKSVNPRPRGPFLLRAGGRALFRKGRPRTRPARGLQRSLPWKALVRSSPPAAAQRWRFREGEPDANGVRCSSAEAKTHDCSALSPSTLTLCCRHNHVIKGLVWG